eukprot:CAMPEP_0194091744 /NCGR_PEP_ID=MMETSP0149-20130528/44273_1 /TAXON_ID=122233 /ORGANISM="Chaetoceros debilis, Strain MM31A-1" /LENGTH=501 /DNA_ID=CAMNT_0038776445 /DNA_START=59 /DNA_END=1564 /DNA_ORIENTATION=-
MNGSAEDEQVVLDELEESFIKDGEAVEVEVNDDDIPMDDDNDDDNEGDNQGGNTDADTSNGGGDVTATAVQPDMSIQTIDSHNSSSVYSVASHYDTNSNILTIVTGGGDDKACLHKLDNANQLGTVPLTHAHTDSVSSVAINEKYVSSDLTKTPKYVAVGAYDGSIILYDPATGAKLKELDGPTDVEFISFHPKGGSVLLAGSISDATIWMYHLPSSKCLQVFVGHECNSEGGGVTGGSFTPDGKFALTIGMDGTMRIWAPRTGMCRHVFKLYEEGSEMEGPAGLTCLAVDGGADGQLAIAGGEDGTAHVVHLQGKKVVAKLSHFDQVPTNSTTAGNGDDEEVFLTSVEAVGFASKAVNPNWAATGGSDGKLKIWDLTHGDGGQCRQTCAVKIEDSSDASNNASSAGPTGGITRIIWHPTQAILFVSYTDGAVRIWDARNGNMLHTLTGGSTKQDAQQINDMSVEVFGTEQGPGTAVIIAANDDGSVKIYNVDVAAILAVP